MTATVTKTVVSVRAELLKKALGRISHVSRTKLEEASSHLLLEVHEDKLTATATDFDCWASIDVPVDMRGDPTAVCVPTSVLVGLVAKSRRDLVEVEIVGDSHITVRSGGEYRVQGLIAEDYPHPRDPEDWTAWTMDAEKLRDGLDFVSWCRSTETSRPILHGVFLDARAGIVVATNGHSLGVVNGVCDPDKGALQANIPPSVVSALLKVLGDGPVELHLSANMVRAVNEGCRLTFRLIEGAYPNYDQVIPKDHTFEALVDRRQLLEAMERAQLFVGQDVHSNVILDWKSGALTVTSHSPDRGQQEEQVDTEGEAELRIKFAVGYLKNALGRLTAERIRFRGTAPERAAIWDDGPESDRYYLIMPKRLLD